MEMVLFLEQTNDKCVSVPRLLIEVTRQEFGEPVEQKTV